MVEFKKVVERKSKTFLLQVETSTNHQDYVKYEELRNEIWHWPEDCLPGSRNMMCENFFHDGSALYIGVFDQADEDALVGFAYGFVGVKDKSIGFTALGNLQFYSQYTGVRKGYEHFGLGVLIKEFQKQALLELLGIGTITCTYDPLTGVNAHRNIHHFGMQVVTYNVDIYGAFGGNLNRADVPSDRFTMSWDLRQRPHRPDYDLELLLGSDLRVTEVDHAEISGRNGPVDLEIIRRHNVELDSDFLLVEIPFDFYRMLAETDVANEKVRVIPREWRMKTREIFQVLFERGYEIIDFRGAEMDGRRRDFYVLKKLAARQAAARILFKARPA